MTGRLDCSCYCPLSTLFVLSGGAAVRPTLSPPAFKATMGDRSAGLHAAASVECYIVCSIGTALGIKKNMFGNILSTALASGVPVGRSRGVSRPSRGPSLRTRGTPRDRLARPSETESHVGVRGVLRYRQLARTCRSQVNNKRLCLPPHRPQRNNDRDRRTRPST